VQSNADQACILPMRMWTVNRTFVLYGSAWQATRGPASTIPGKYPSKPLEHGTLTIDFLFMTWFPVGLLLLGQSPVAFGAFCKVCSASSSEKLPGFWLGGNSLKEARNCPTYCCAGTRTKAWSTRHRP